MPSFNINEKVRLTLTPAGSLVWLGYQQSLGQAEALLETTIETTLYEAFTVFGPAMAACQPPMFEGGMIEFPVVWGCSHCRGTAVHEPGCERRSDPLPPDPLPLPWSWSPH